ncbi:MAG: O-antigen ligase family protein [Planctomycetales bacterium]|nr:O-antigen ligase family protein [Planctomycetales bacterium]
MLILGVIVIAPWLQGGTSAVQQAALFAALLVALAVSVVPLVLAPSRRHPLPWLLLPVLGGIALGLWQLQPRSNPGSGSAVNQLRAEFGQLDDSNASDAASFPLTVSTAATRREVALLIAALAVVALGAVFFARTAYFQYLVAILAANGVLLCAFDLWQKATWNGLLMWQYPLPKNATPYGPFYYHNQAAGYLSICLGAAIVWLLLVRQGLWQRAGDGDIASPRGLLDAVLTCWPAIAATIVILAIAQFATLSRGGVLATLGATVIAGLIVSRSGKSKMRFGTLAFLVIGGLGVLGWIVMSDTVATRMQTLASRETMSEEIRLPLWRDTLDLARDFFPWGSGLGTFRYTYLKYHSHDSELWYTHAHNQYLEAAADGGLPALLVFGLAVLLMVWALISLARLRDKRDEPFLILGTFILVSQLLHGVVDFIPYLAPNMMLIALLCGAVAGRATLRVAKGPTGRLLGWRWPGWAMAVVTCAIFAAMMWSWRETRIVARLEQIRGVLPWKGQPAEAVPETLAAGIQDLQNALELRPDDAESHEALAELWITLYRVRARAAILREMGFKPDDPNVWNFTDPVLLHHLAQQHQRASDSAALAELRTEETIATHLQPALNHLRAARQACPLLGHMHMRLAELCFLDSTPNDDALHLERAARLAHSKPDLLVEIGRLEFSADRKDRAYAAWQRCLTVTDRYDEAVLQFASQGLTADALIHKLLPPAPLRILDFVRLNYSHAEADRDARDAILDYASQLAESPGHDLSETLYVRAATAALRGKTEQAIVAYQEAVFQRPERISWRFELAQLLAAQGDVEAAQREARWCLRARPRSREYREFLESLHNSSRIRQGRYNQVEGVQTVH